MKSPNQKHLVSFAKTLLVELGKECAVSVERDIKTLESRVSAEGVSFLTITLPALGDWLLSAVEHGVAATQPPPAFKSFHSKEVGARLPAFLSGFAVAILTTDQSKSEDSRVRALRNYLQFARAFAKITSDVPEKAHRAAIRQYVTTDEEVNKNDNFRDDRFYARLRDVARRLFRNSLGRVDYTLAQDGIVPRHGPGATADGLAGNQKYKLATWSDRLERISPAVDNLLPSYRYWEESRSFTWEPEGQETPVKVITVPKTAKGPRVIAMEPTYVQYAQQGVRSLVYEAVRNSDMRWFLEFEDQGRNQDHARQGSVTRETATLDLSEASDRVSWKLVQELFSSWPTFLEWLDATRSRRALVDGEVRTIHKYASMGSALCFPIEAMVFLTIIVATIEEKLGVRYKASQAKAWASLVSVYGDDLVVPAYLADDVAAQLGEAGLVVNRKKSFWKGPFRESCGHDYYKGHFVTSVRVRTLPPASRRDVEELVSWSSLRNQLYSAGLWETAAWVDTHMTRILKDYPIGYDQSSSISRKSFLKDVPGRVSGRNHYLHNRGWLIRSRIPRNEVDGVGALVKCLTTSSEDAKHLTHSGRPRGVSMYRGWVVAP